MRASASRRLKATLACGALLLGIMSGCAVGPEYRKPELNLPANWNAPQNGTVSDVAGWWSRFKDPRLDALIAAALKDNPSIDKAAAAIEKARAKQLTAQADFLPAVSAEASNKSSGSYKNSSGVTRTSSALLDASWELDLVGKTRRSTESASALLTAREADLREAQVSLTAEVAADYIEYRAARLKQQYYEDQAASQEKTSALTAIAARAGFKAPADAELAAASAASTRSTAIAQQAECDLLIKSLVALTGLNEDEVRQQLGSGAQALAEPEGLKIDAVPANLLRQRPDIIAAERELASTSALIGVAEAAMWPSLSLSGSVGLTSTQGATRTAPWAFGPSLNLPIFSGGSIRADIKSAKADYAEAEADYKQTVRDAVKEVEQALVNLDSSSRRVDQEVKSAQGYQVYLKATEQNWRTGGASQLDLETARRSAITAEVSLLELKENRLLYWISLYKAVGGAWQSSPEGASK